MGEARDRHYYDRIYGSSETYAQSHVKAPWAPLWQFVAKHVHPEDTVLDLGCGPGHLAATLVDAGLRPINYVGVDFSEIAIAQARTRVAEATFLHMQMPGCVMQLVLRYAPSVITFCEVLEHLGHDHDLMSIHLLPVGLKIIGTVPSFDDPAHVRTFDGPEAVVARYGKMLDIDQLDWVTQTHLGFVARRRRQ
jgi:2-polyprenyl-3-methyl-5-hydroxy-6-metoxy-1,4-benzoquinol methylase